SSRRFTCRQHCKVSGRTCVNPFVGWTRSLVMAPAPDAVASTVVARPAPSHDASKPTAAILLGNTLSEPTDVLGPYAIFAESGAYKRLRGAHACLHSRVRCLHEPLPDRPRRTGACIFVRT